MNNYYINAILKEIWSNLSCKKCWNKITLDKIKLVSQSWSIANFEIICPNCGSIMKVSAEVSSIKEEVPVRAEEKPKLKWEIDIKDTVTTNDDLKEVSKKLNKFSSFKSLFWVLLIVMTFTLSSCGNWEVKDDIVSWIEQAKEKWSEIYKDWKNLTASASVLIDQAPEKIDEIKKDAEKVMEDAKNAKKQADEKIQQAKDALEKAEEAQSAFWEALDAFYKLIWVSWSWTWTNLETWSGILSGSWGSSD